MKMSDENICDFYRFQARDGFGREAIGELARANRCSTDEIVSVLQKNGLALKYYEKQEEKDMARNPDKEGIIRDYKSGMTCREIGERYGKNPRTILNDLKNWHVWQSKEKEPAPAATGTSPADIKNDTTESISQKSENVKSRENPEEKRENMVNWLYWLTTAAEKVLGERYLTGDGTYGDSGFEITAARAENEKGKAAVAFTADGKIFNLILEVCE